MAGKIDALLKLSIVAAVLLASSSVAYYHLIYLPERDARIDAAKAAAEQRRSYEAAAAEQRRADEAALAERLRAIDKTTARKLYELCVSEAEDDYNLNWTNNCASKTSCTLPAYIADGLNTNRNKARDRCLQEFKSGLY